MKKILLVIVALLVLIPGAAFAWLVSMSPEMRAPSPEKIQATPERLARGKYLAESVAMCFSCHSDTQLDRYAMPARPGTEGTGNSICWGPELGFPGRVCFPNLTPDPETGLGAWTDGEIMRAIREGVDKNGEALFLMPSSAFGKLSDEDARSIVVFLRSLPPVKVKRERTKLDFPINYFIKMAPKPLAGPVLQPNRADPVAYGEYLSMIAGCRDCHTPVDDQYKPLPGMEFAGGQEFKLGDKIVERSPNLTPHATGIASMTKESFIGIFRAFADREAVAVEVKLEENTVMPFLDYAHMTDEDLGAIYDYLRTVKPIENSVVKRGPATVKN